MNAPSMQPRSPRRLDRTASALLVVDMQERLLPAIAHSRSLAWNASRLLRGAALFGVGVEITEQYPQRLGATDPALVSPDEAEQQTNGRRFQKHEKKAFSIAACDRLLANLSSSAVRQVVIAGIESHVCVLQSCLDLLSEGYDVFVALDAIGSRYRIDHETAVRRMRDEGATVLTTESVLFEWCETSADEQFKPLSALVKESPPEDAAGS